jgi:UDP-N-acetylmuramate: L-alanyl-gamma-D-glutamyl-meso-diaminopimelate ligase
MAADYGIDAEAITAGLRSFRSVKRRLEVKAEAQGITIIDDFAHHPTAIAQTLQAVRTRYAGRRLWAILEPRSNTLRRKVFQRDVAESLSAADEIVLAGIFRSEAIPEAERLDPGAVVSELRSNGKSARLLETADDIVDSVARELRKGDVVVILSNGGFGGIYDKLPARLRSLHEVTTHA